MQFTTCIRIIKQFPSFINESSLTMTDSEILEHSAETTPIENNYRLQRPKGQVRAEAIPSLGPVWRNRLSIPRRSFWGMRGRKAMMLTRPRSYGKLRSQEGIFKLFHINIYIHTFIVYQRPRRHPLL